MKNEIKEVMKKGTRAIMKSALYASHFVVASALTLAPLQLATAQTAQASEPVKSTVDLCKVAAPSLVSTIQGTWTGTQRKWNAQGELQRTLASEFTFELLAPASDGALPVLQVAATYKTPEGVQVSANKFTLQCNATTGVWSESVVGFGDVKVTPISAQIALHQVEAKSAAGTLRSVSLWDFSAAGTWVLTTSWYMNDVVSATSVNQMTRN